MDKPEGLFSTMEVDSVDFNKFSKLEGIQYLQTELHAGDCIFIPYKW